MLLTVRDRNDVEVHWSGSRRCFFDQDGRRSLDDWFLQREGEGVSGWTRCGGGGVELTIVAGEGGEERGSARV